jgi:hypothetical protein
LHLRVVYLEWVDFYFFLIRFLLPFGQLAYFHAFQLMPVAKVLERARPPSAASHDWFGAPLFSERFEFQVLLRPVTGTLGTS